MPIEFACPSCAKKYRVKDELAGKTAKCADCTTRIQIPAAAKATASPSAPAKSSSAAAPKPAAPARPAASAAATPSKPKDAGMASWLDEELAAMPKPVVATSAAIKSPSAKPSTPSATSGTCPNCRKTMNPGAVVCVACGYHTIHGKKLATSKGDDAAAPAKKKSFALGASASFGRGALFSAIGAAIGAAIWAGVAIGTGYEIGWIAWGLGGLAGAGMALGHEDNDGTAAGITASGISILGILGAKFGIYQYFAGMASDVGLSMEALGALSGEDTSFGALFSPIDGLFVLLSVGTAYKLGSGQATD